MRLALAALALSLAPAALADVSRPVQAAGATMAATSQSGSFHAHMYQRYCDKLREGPEAYAAFVKRMATVTGYTFSDFAQLEPGAPVRAECRGTNGMQAARAAAR